MPEDGSIMRSSRPTSDAGNGQRGSGRGVDDRLSRALDTIEAQRRQLMTVFNAVTDAIIVIDDRGIMETVNDAACKMFDRPSFELVHHSVNKLMPASVAMNHDRFLRDARSTPRAAFGEPRALTGVDGKGRQFPISISLSEVPRTDNEPRRYVATIRDLTKERAREDRIRFLAYHDDATKLPNRHGLISYLDSYFAEPDPKPMLFVHLALNDTSQLAACFGIEEFEQLVVAFSQRLKRVFGTALLIARGFGNTFHIVLPQEQTEALEDNLQSIVADPLEIRDMSVVVDICASTVALPNEAKSANEAMHKAAATLMEVTSITPLPGRPRLHAYVPSIIEEMSRRTRMVHQIRHAIEQKEFSVFLQPKVDIVDGRWIGAEALARWTQPDGTMVSPGEFIPLAEQSGLVSTLNRYMLTATLASLAESDWCRSARISVNISTQDLLNPSYASDVAQMLTEHGIDASTIELELTERDIARGSHIVHTTLDELRAIGVTIAMDDFGTGYSSLAALADLPVDVLKIDRQFLRRVEDRETDRKVLATLVKMVQDLGREIVVEGVETESQADFLRTLDIRSAQGFLYAKPSPAIAVLNDPRRPRASDGA